jgi:hypothetical protein
MFDLLCCKSWTLLKYCFTLVDYFKSHCFSTNQTSSLNIFAQLQFLHCCLRLTALKTNNHSRVTFVCILYYISPFRFYNPCQLRVLSLFPWFIAYPRVLSSSSIPHLFALLFYPLLRFIRSVRPRSISVSALIITHFFGRADFHDLFRRRTDLIIRRIVLEWLKQISEAHKKI